MSRLNRIFRKRINKKMQKKLVNKDFSLFCNNCTAAFLLHDLGLRFNSPCVNLFMYEPDYLKFISDLKHYQGCELKFIKTNHNYPVAELDDITIYFMHYESEQEAENKWIQRFKRINYDNMFFILHQREKCTDEIIKQFDDLPYKNKVSFTCKPYPQYKSNFCIENNETNGYLDHLYTYKNRFTGKKHYDDFDFVEWFNNSNK